MTTAKSLLTLPLFLAWAKAKPQDEVFNYLNGTGYSGSPACPLHQYLTEAGFTDVMVYGNDYNVGLGYEAIPTPIWKGLERLIAHWGVEFTFGQLVAALETETRA